jgi:hypothetical protein
MVKRGTVAALTVLAGLAAAQLPAAGPVRADSGLHLFSYQPDTGGNVGFDPTRAASAPFSQSQGATSAPRGLNLGDGVIFSPSFVRAPLGEMIDPSNSRTSRESWLRFTVPLNQPLNHPFK